MVSSPASVPTTSGHSSSSMATATELAWPGEVLSTGLLPIKRGWIASQGAESCLAFRPGARSPVAQAIPPGRSACVPRRPASTASKWRNACERPGPISRFSTLLVTWMAMSDAGAWLTKTALCCRSRLCPKNSSRKSTSYSTCPGETKRTRAHPADNIRFSLVVAGCSHLRPRKRGPSMLTSEK
jgi:hypothetical protein